MFQVPVTFAYGFAGCSEAVCANIMQEFADNGGEERRRVFGDKLTIGLMIAVCVLCLGIIGVLFYWLKNFL